MYDLNIPEDEQENVLGGVKRVAPARGGKCPACNQAIKDSAVICIKCGFSLAEGKRMETAVKQVKPEAEGDTEKVQLSDADEVVDKARKAALAQGRDTDRKLAGDAVLRAGADEEHRMKEYIIPVFTGVVMLLLMVLMTPLGTNITEVSESLANMWGLTSPAAIWVSWLWVYGLKAVYFGLMYVSLWIGLIVLNALMGVGIGAINSAILKVASLAVSVVLMSTVYTSVLSLLTGGMTIPGGMGVMVHMALILALFYVLSYQYFELEGREPLLLFVLSIGIPGALYIVILYFIALNA
ncbi:zinc ribbon domain-containing protein [Planctomycetota bacterium]|nr:zinc ribbon domain-containing protein [Planctomycetota bacterium]